MCTSSFSEETRKLQEGLGRLSRGEISVSEYIDYRNQVFGIKQPEIWHYVIVPLVADFWEAVLAFVRSKKEKFVRLFLRV